MRKKKMSNSKTLLSIKNNPVKLKNWESFLENNSSLDHWNFWKSITDILGKKMINFKEFKIILLWPKKKKRKKEKSIFFPNAISLFFIDSVTHFLHVVVFNVLFGEFLVVTFGNENNSNDDQQNSNRDANTQTNDQSHIGTTPIRYRKRNRKRSLSSLGMRSDFITTRVLVVLGNNNLGVGNILSLIAIESDQAEIGIVTWF